MRLVGVAKLWAWSVPGLMLLVLVGAWKGAGQYRLPPSREFRNPHADRLPFCASRSRPRLGLPLLSFSLDCVAHSCGRRIATPSVHQRIRFRRCNFRTEIPSGAIENGATQFIVASAALSLLAGTALRAEQIHGFIARHQRQLPAYAGTERRVVILDTRQMFYGRDLIQNDPFLREDVITMITHASQADAAMMRTHFPDMHEVYADRFGTVWSERAASP